MEREDRANRADLSATVYVSSGNHDRKDVQSIQQSAAISPGQTSRKINDLDRGGCAMSVIGWIILGLISGFIASKIVNKTGQGFFMDIVLGIVGAIVGGVIFSALGIGGITGFNLYSMVVAVIGAIIVLVIYHWVSGRRAV
jgi:uncharacterized membrane protein YeaQ/YmgE (transglycosylase-associated protein family)